MKDSHSIRNGEFPRAATAQLMIYGTLLECGIGLIAVIAGWLLDLPLWETVRWESRAIAMGAGATLPLFGLLFLVEWMPGRVFAVLRQILDQTVAPLFRSATLWEIAMVSLVAGLGEEAFFRGIIQRGVARMMAPQGYTGTLDAGTVLPILVGAILFGFAHPLSRLYIILTTAIGAYLGVLFTVTGNLLVPVVTHAMYDFFAILYLVHLKRRSAPGSSDRPG